MRDNDSLILYKLIKWLREEEELLNVKGDATEDYAGAAFLYARATECGMILSKIQMLEAGL